MMRTIYFVKCVFRFCFRSFVCSFVCLSVCWFVCLFFPVPAGANAVGRPAHRDCAPARGDSRGRGERDNRRVLGTPKRLPRRGAVRDRRPQGYRSHLETCECHHLFVTAAKTHPTRYLPRLKRDAWSLVKILFHKSNK